MKQGIAGVCVAALLAAGAYAEGITPKLGAGTQQISGGGSYDADYPLGSQFELQLGYGYFIADNLEVIALGGFSDNDMFSTYSVGGGLEYNFPTTLLDGRLVPHIGVAGLWAGGKIDDNEAVGRAGNDDSTVVGRIFAGPKFFINENVALVLEATYSLAADDIYMNEDGKREDTNFKSIFSIRYYY